MALGASSLLKQEDVAVKISTSGLADFSKTSAWLTKIQKLDIGQIAQAGAQRGVRALAAATPRDSSRAASSWAYEVKKTANSTTIIWTNSDIENGFPVVIMLQYGHGTGTGGYVQGFDFINPAIRPIFDEIAQSVWKAVTSA
jgi:hypothetical protein